MQVLHTYFSGSYANFRPSRRDETTGAFLHESAVIPGGPGTRRQRRNVSAPGAEQEPKLITAAVLTTANVINNLLSVPGWRTKCFLTRRYHLPTKARLHPPPLSESVLSIIHEICFRFFSDSTQHISAASLSSHAYVFVVWPDCFHVVGCTGGLGGGGGRRRFVSFQCYHQDWKHQPCL